MAETYGAPVEKLDDFGTDDPGRTVRRWLAELRTYERTYRKWEDEVDRIIKRYRDESPINEGQPNASRRRARYGVLWSTFETVAPLLYSQRPVPEVSRRFKDRDPIGRVASEVMERALTSLLDAEDFSEPMKAARFSFQAGGRGTVWLRYVPIFGTETEPLDPANPDAGTFNSVVNEIISVEHVHFKDFRHQVAATWNQVGWVARRVRMTREQLIKRFGHEVGSKVTLGAKAEGIGEQDLADFGDVFKRAEVWEIWDKDRGEVIWICSDYTTGWLDRKKDPLRLRGFFPCPRPAYGTITPDTLVPVPEATSWRSQTDELDRLTDRIAKITRAIKAIGVFNKSQEELVDLLNDNLENQMIGIDDWMHFAEGGGLKGSVDFVPLEMFVTALQAVIQARNEAKQDFFEVSGIADIIRGASDPTETLGAQQIKARFAGARLEDKQREIQRFVRDVIEMMGEIVAEHFDAPTIALISNYPEAVNARPEDFAGALQMMKDDRLRTFRIDIETDSTIAPDRQDERQKRIDMLSAVAPLLEKATAAIQSDPAFKPIVGQLLLFAVRGFEVGRQYETTFENFIESLGTAQPQEDPTAAIEAGKLEIQRTKVQNDYDIAIQKVQVERDKLAIEQSRLFMERWKAEREGGMKERETVAAIDKSMAEIRARDRQLDIESEKLIAQRDQADAGFAIQDQQIADQRAQRDAERMASEDTTDYHAEMADGVAAIADLAPALMAVVEALGQTVAGQQQAMTVAMQRFTAVAQQMVDAATAPKEIVRDETGRVQGARVLAPGTTMIQ